MRTDIVKAVIAAVASVGLRTSALAMDAAQRKSDLDFLVDQIAAHYAYLPDSQVDLTRLRTIYEPRAEGAETPGTFLHVIEEAVSELHGFNPRQVTIDGLTIDYDVAFKLRDGVTIYTDIYRPAGVEGPLPVVLLWSAYGKHFRWPEPMRSIFTQNSGASDYAPIECQDPLVWCPAGYAIVVPDPRGINHSQGDATAWSPQEGDDIHDTIEWIAEQPWSNGRVGMAGASYFGIVQWFAGVTRPPHLAALMPYDGMSDLYREIVVHGGIPNYGFVSFWNAQVRASPNRAEDWMKAMKVHPFFDDYWQSKAPPVEKIDIPTYVISCWSDHAVHTRGSLSAFMRLSTKQKWLEVHGRNKWARMYTAESTRRQFAFFDRFLKGVPNEVDDWPKVRLEVREGIDVGKERAEAEWPLARTQYTPFYLNVSNGSLSPAPVTHASSIAYDATSPEPVATFSHTFSQDTELTGYFKLKLWVETAGADDMDLFVAVQKFNTAGELVNFYYITRFLFGHAAHGWLRVSRRELDEARSKAYQPFHTHQSELLLEPGEIVPVEIEIWPSSTLFRGRRDACGCHGQGPVQPASGPARHWNRAPPCHAKRGQAHHPHRRSVRQPHSGPGRSCRAGKRGHTMSVTDGLDSIQCAKQEK